MKIIIVDNNGYQLASIPYNCDTELKIGTILERYGVKYTLTKFKEISYHYIVFEGVEEVI